LTVRAQIYKGHNPTKGQRLRTFRLNNTNMTIAHPWVMCVFILSLIFLNNGLLLTVVVEDITSHLPGYIAKETSRRP